MMTMMAMAVMTKAVINLELGTLVLRHGLEPRLPDRLL